MQFFEDNPIKNIYPLLISNKSFTILIKKQRKNKLIFIELTYIVRRMDMLNTTLKKDAIRELKNEIEDHKKAGNETTTLAVKLHESRNNSVVVIDSIEQYVNGLANTPKQFDKELAEIKVNLSSFKILSEIEYDEQTMIKIAGGGTAAGVATGVATPPLLLQLSWQSQLHLVQPQLERQFLDYQVPQRQMLLSLGLVAEL